MKKLLVFLLPFLLHSHSYAADSILKNLLTAKLSSDVFAEEDKDYGVEPIGRPYDGKLSLPTPISLPGATVINTGQLLRMIQSDVDPIIVDVGSGRKNQSIPNAIFWRNVGDAKGEKAENSEQVLSQNLKEVFWAEHGRPIVFLAGINWAKNKTSKAWLSYNAALRAVNLGYTDVYWYRGGREAWIEAGLPTRSLMPPHLRN